MELRYQSKEIYPEVQVEKKNPFYGEILLQNYTGLRSELTTILTYLYQQTIEEEYKEVKEALANITKVEMHHMKILAELIQKLGIDPKYRTIECFEDRPVYWKAVDINYETDIQKILKNDIEAEEMTIRQYESHMHAIQDIHVQKILKRLILDEEIHVETFKALQKMIKDKMKKDKI